MLSSSAKCDLRRRGPTRERASCGSCSSGAVEDESDENVQLLCDLVRVWRSHRVKDAHDDILAGLEA